MRDGVQTASIYPFSTQKIFAPLPFCKWLVSLDVAAKRTTAGPSA